MYEQETELPNRNGTTAWAMAQIGQDLYVNSLQVPNMGPQAVRNLRHTPPSLGAANIEEVGRGTRNGYEASKGSKGISGL